ncbi:hypothetical protein [Timonella sp. A28]|uniref:hypothetical protein n=1 Tax=Timonella sp. A28 TaxID=3442640 RepID=UPI003EB9E9F2
MSNGKEFPDSMEVRERKYGRRRKNERRNSKVLSYMYECIENIAGEILVLLFACVLVVIFPGWLEKLFTNLALFILCVIFIWLVFSRKKF